jgi:hypothetical protein
MARTSWIMETRFRLITQTFCVGVKLFLSAWHYFVIARRPANATAMSNIALTPPRGSDPFWGRYCFNTTPDS